VCVLQNGLLIVVSTIVNELFLCVFDHGAGEGIHGTSKVFERRDDSSVELIRYRLTS